MALAAVAAVPWVLPVAGFADAIAAGSRGVFVIVLPVLICVLLTAFDPPGGVVDSETNWIAALLACAAAVATVVLAADRIPTLTQLWRIDLLGPIAWTAAATAILLGIRYAVRLWDVWLLMIAASPFPFLMMAASAGGSDMAVTAVACFLAALVVARSVRSCPPMWIAGATVTSLVLGVSTAWLFLAMPAAHGVGLIVAVVIGAGLVPLGVSFAVRARAPRTAPGDNHSPAEIPNASARVAVVLIGLAAAVAVVSPVPPTTPAPPQALGDWIERGNLVPVRSFHAAALLGPQATFTRYQPAQSQSPIAAVDVITAPTRGILDDVSDAQWYPRRDPIDFRPAAVADVDSVLVRSAHSIADTDVDPHTPHWYLLTWTWQVEAGFQQVIVVVSQRENTPLPDPSGMSTADLLVNPALWVARQQPRHSSQVDTRTVEVAHQIAHRLIVAADVHRGNPNDD